MKVYNTTLVTQKYKLGEKNDSSGEEESHENSPLNAVFSIVLISIAVVFLFVNVFYVHKFCMLNKNFSEFRDEVEKIPDVDQASLEIDRRIAMMKLDDILSENSLNILRNLQNSKDSEDDMAKNLYNKRYIREAEDCNCPKGYPGGPGTSGLKLSDIIEAFNEVSGSDIGFSLIKLQGSQGPPGEMIFGPPGEDGLDGESSYGAKGEPGLDGLPGIQGSEGMKGEPGDMGGPGLSGRKGEPWRDEN